MQFWVLSPCTEHWVVCSFQCFIYFIQNIQNNFGIKFKNLLHLVQGSLTQNFSFTPSSFLYSLWFHFYLLIPSIQPSLNFLSDPYYLVISLWFHFSPPISLISLFFCTPSYPTFLFLSLRSDHSSFTPASSLNFLRSHFSPQLPLITLFCSPPSDPGFLLNSSDPFFRLWFPSINLFFSVTP